jgi:hypothetical protein
VKKGKAFRSSFPPRQRFNWGYHAGAMDERDHRTPAWTRARHYDVSYEAGYWEGKEDQQQGAYREDSSQAWVRKGGRPDPWYVAA